MLKHCKPCEGGVSPMALTEIQKNLETLKNWNLSDDQKSIWKFWVLKNHHQVMSFLNAIAFISNRENHHPDISFGYNSCRVNYTTHAIDGLSENDFICASKIDALEE
ncbi:MAG: 4a-hydroxytetrahydrobiopterin dehydratase [Myxococcaceae bacterium]